MENQQSGSLLQGVHAMGGWGIVEGRSEGIILMGYSGEAQVDNGGVFIAGNLLEKRLNSTDVETQKEDCFVKYDNKSAGIAIVGSVKSLDAPGQRKPGFVQFSTLKNYAHEIHGHIKLMDDFHCYNKDGVEIFNGSTAKTISELQTRVLELEKLVSNNSKETNSSNKDSLVNSNKEI